MDTANRFHTDQSFRWVRAEAALALAGLAYLRLAFFAEVRWSRFLVAFVALDLVGYVPGAIAYRLARRRRQASRLPAQPIRIAPIFHHLYNLTHSFVSVFLLLGLWWWQQGDVEWAMLALPLHLLGDRSLFGNTYKPAALPFEPEPSAAPSPGLPATLRPAH
jgi:membrane-bound metal-dependent hydrolase YbcI (DUF457 family)